MGVSLLTAWIIEANEVVIVTGSQDGKWGASICYSKYHPAHPCMPILTLNPQFASREEAQLKAEDVVAAAKAAAAAWSKEHA